MLLISSGMGSPTEKAQRPCTVSIFEVKARFDGAPCDAMQHRRADDFTYIKPKRAIRESELHVAMLALSSIKYCDAFCGGVLPCLLCAVTVNRHRSETRERLLDEY